MLFTDAFNTLFTNETLAINQTRFLKKTCVSPMRSCYKLRFAFSLFSGNHQPPHTVGHTTQTKISLCWWNYRRFLHWKLSHDNLHCRKWRKFRQNGNVSVSVTARYGSHTLHWHSIRGINIKCGLLKLNQLGRWIDPGWYYTCPPCFYVDVITYPCSNDIIYNDSQFLLSKLSWF